MHWLISLRSNFFFTIDSDIHSKHWVVKTCIFVQNLPEILFHDDDIQLCQNESKMVPGYQCQILEGPRSCFTACENNVQQT